MGKRLVLRASEPIALSELEKFVNEAYKQGMKRSELVEWGTSDGLLLGIQLTKQEKKEPVPETQKKEETPKEKPRKRKVSKRKVDPDKVRCPVCNAPKPVVRSGSIYVVKPHVVKGEPCSGNSTQVIKGKNGRSSFWRIVTEEG